ncbi:Putative catechol O-methyltransferase 2 [Verticillium dahliae VDG1]|nr:Putative catechol O-methyltransferase 2 [Verticillium dahliae VDG1]
MLLMSSKYRPLLPNTTPASSSTEDASGSQSQSSLSGLVQIPRTGIRAACESCRKKKTRVRPSSTWLLILFRKSCKFTRVQCNGGRPMCNRCIETTTECIYRTDEEEKKVSALERRNGEVMAELEQLRELYGMIHSRSTEEAQEIFNHIRTNSDPIDVLQMVKASDLLLQGTSPEAAGMEAQTRRERTSK